MILSSFISLKINILFLNYHLLNSITFLNSACLRQTSSVNLYLYLLSLVNGLFRFLVRFNCYFLKSRFRSIALPLLPTSLQIFRGRPGASKTTTRAQVMRAGASEPQERGGGVTSQDKWISSRSSVL